MKDMTKGILAILASSLFLALSQTLIKYAGDVSTIQKMFIRSLVMCILTLTTLLRHRVPLRIERAFALPLLLRGICGTAGNLCNFYATDNMPLSDATMLAKLSPFFSVFFSWLLLKERFGFTDVAALIMAFIGTAFIIKPGGDLAELLPALAGLTGGIMAGFTYACIHWCHKRGAPGELNAFFYAFVSVLVTLPKMLFDYEPMSFFQISVMVACGVCGALGVGFVTLAYKFAQPNQVSVFEYTQVLYTAVFGFLFFSQLPDPLSFCGYAIIIGAELFKYFYDSRHRSKR